MGRDKDRKEVEERIEVGRPYLFSSEISDLRDFPRTMVMARRARRDAGGAVDPIPRRANARRLTRWAN